MEDSVRKPKTWEELKDQYGGMDMQVAENCIEYAIFAIPETQDRGARKQLSLLEAIRKAALELSGRLTKDFIWQRGEFSLSLKNEHGLVYLHGTTDYGDSVEDEWLIVYILREISKSFPQAWIRVWDADGEFLLVEAANVVPRWLSPNMDTNRSWIHNGSLFVIPPDKGSDKSPALRPLTLPEAIARVEAYPKSLFHSALVEAEAFYRLEKYPQHISSAIHHALVRIPRKIAYVLHEQPKAVAPAVEEFYLRDAVALKPFSSDDPSTLTFPPVDLVTVSVRFTKVLYAQLYSQRLDTLPAWQKAMNQLSADSPTATDVERRARIRAELGMKLACGFELMMKKAEKSNSRVVREVALLMEDMEEDGDGVLPSDEAIRGWKDVNRDDDDSWMDIDINDLERTLDGKRNGAGQRAKFDSGFGDPSAQADLQKIVSRFEEFMNDDKAGVEGAELSDDSDLDDEDEDDDDSDDEDKEVSFDEKEFARMMREMLGIPLGAADAQQESGTEESPDLEQDSEEAAIKQLTAQMEAELRGHGALKLDATPAKPPALESHKGKEKEEPSGEMERMKGLQATDEDDTDGSEVDVDYNLVKNLLESFKGQAGMAGPVGNILGMMGMQLPRDEDEGHEEET